MLVFNMRRTLDRPRRIDVADNRIRLIVVVSQLEQRRGHGLIDNLNHSPADQFLELHQGKVRLYTGRRAVHHETDYAGWGQDPYLAVAVAVLFAVGEGFVPALLAGFVEGGGDVG